MAREKIYTRKNRRQTIMFICWFNKICSTNVQIQQIVIQQIQQIQIQQIQQIQQIIQQIVQNLFNKFISFWNEIF